MTEAMTEWEVLHGLAFQVQQRIAEHAYHIFETGGFQHGHDIEHWLQAENEGLNFLSYTVHAQQYSKQANWVHISHKLAALFPPNCPEQMGCMTTIQKLARFELEIIKKDTAYWIKRLRQIAERPGDLDDILTYSYLWVLGAYEIIRTLTEKTGHPRLKQARGLFERIRIPLAKLEASRAYKAQDFSFPYPVISGLCIGWAVNQNDIVLREALSSEFFDALNEYCEIQGVKPESLPD